MAPPGTMQTGLVCVLHLRDLASEVCCEVRVDLGRTRVSRYVRLYKEKKALE